MALITLPHIYRYRVTTPDGSESWEWSDVGNDFEHIDEINTGGGAIEVVLNRSLNSQTITVDELTDDDDETIDDDDDQPLLVESAEVVRIGEGTDLAINNYLFVDEFYGRMDELTDDDDETIDDDDDVPLLWEYGAIDGRRAFSGFISKIRTRQEAGREQIVVTALPFSADLEETIFEVELGSNINNYNSVVLASGLGAPEGIYRDEVAQSFTATATGWLRYIAIGIQVPYVESFPYATVTCRVYTGDDPNGSRSLVSSLTVTKDVRPLAGTGYTLVLTMPEDCQVTSGSDYHFTVSCPQARLSGGEGAVYVQITGDTYGSGAGYERASLAGSGLYTTLASDRDLYFHLFIQTSFVTRYPFATTDPGQLALLVVNKVAGNGERLGLPYLNIESSSIEYVDAYASEIPVNTNTAREVIEACLRASPIGWYWRYDQATRYIYFQPKPTVPEHIFVIGRHLKSVDITENLENVVNTVYFTGGEVGGTTMFTKTWLPSSVAKYGVKARRITDGRVTNSDHADLIADYEIYSNIEPVYETEITVLDEVYDTGTIQVGQLVGFTNGGEYVDSKQLQVMRRERARGLVHLTLGARPMTDRRKLEDMRTALAALEAQNNPDSPS